MEFTLHKDICRLIMREKNISQQALADGLETNQSAIGRLLDTKSSELQVVSQGMLFGIANVLEVPFLELIGALPVKYEISPTEIEHPERFANAVFKFIGNGLQKLEIMTIPQEKEDQDLLRKLVMKIEELHETPIWDIHALSSLEELDLKLELNNLAKHFLDDREMYDITRKSEFSIYGYLGQQLVYHPSLINGPLTDTANRFVISLSRRDIPPENREFNAFSPDFDQLEISNDEVLRHRFWHQKLTLGD